MPNLETTYMNLKLKNPIIVGSSGIPRSINKIKECAESGAGAIVLKSLFEESLAGENYGVEPSMLEHTDAYDYKIAELEKLYGSRDYTELIKNAKKAVDIPIIASINCISDKWWPNFAEQIESAGADAIELNVYTAPQDASKTGQEIEQLYFNILKAVKEKVKIPVALKMGSNFSSIPAISSALSEKGANGLVLFNRFTQPDIDIKNLELRTTFSFTSSDDIHIPLRWIAILYGQFQASLCATTGIHKADDLIKLLLAGASAVQVASLLYKKGLGAISGLLDGLEQWMAQHNFESLDQVIGKLSFQKSNTPDYYLRAQFIEKTTTES